MNTGAPSLQKSYTFSKAEYESILELFSILQKVISSAQNMPDKTKSKLFEKLGEMILFSELSVNNLDVFWSFIARTEIAFKIYERSRIPDSLKRLTMTIWRVQCRVEGRPVNSAPPILF
jgi:hypothetical protein